MEDRTAEQLAQDYSAMGESQETLWLKMMPQNDRIVLIETYST